MAKVLKVVALVAGTALAIITAIPSGGTSIAGWLGVSGALLRGGLLAISIASSVGGSLLSPHPKSPANSPASVDRMRATIDPRTPRKTMVGITALPVDIR